MIFYNESRWHEINPTNLFLSEWLHDGGGCSRTCTFLNRPFEDNTQQH